MAVGLVIVSTLRDSPEDRGFPPVEVKDEPGVCVNFQTYSCLNSDVVRSNDALSCGDNKTSNTLIRNLLQNVLSNPFIWYF